MKFPDKLRIVDGVKIVGPFANETEEANWWYDNREWLDEDFMRSMAEGRVKIRHRQLSRQGTRLCEPYTGGKKTLE